MAFGRRKKATRGRKYRRVPARRSSFRRKRNSKYSRKRQTTGIGLRKYIKVRKDIIYNFPTNTTPAPSWNVLICGGAQTANLQGFSFFDGSSTSAVDVGIDVTGATGLSQWFNFYERYYVCGSKVKINMNATLSAGGGEADSMVATLVPTVGYPLCNDSAGNNFDIQAIDPGELPYARRTLVNSSYGGQTRMSSYLSVKRLLGVKDLADATSSTSSMTVPQMTDATTIGTSFQPSSGAIAPKGIYWNLVLQNPQQYAQTIGAVNYAGATIRMQVTSYICFSGRKPLHTL